MIWATNYIKFWNQLSVALTVICTLTLHSAASEITCKVIAILVTRWYQIQMTLVLLVALDKSWHSNCVDFCTDQMNISVSCAYAREQKQYLQLLACSIFFQSSVLFPTLKDIIFLHVNHNRTQYVTVFLAVSLKREEYYKAYVIRDNSGHSIPTLQL